MSSQNQAKQPLYPEVLDYNPEINSVLLSNPNPPPSSLYPTFDKPSPYISSDPKPSVLYPSVDMKDLANLFPDSDAAAPSLPPPVEEIFLRIPGAILHLIDRNHSVELASGEFTVVRLRQGQSIVAVLARVGPKDDLDDSGVQWPLTKDEASVKLDKSHYFFSLHVPKTEIHEDDESYGILNYGLTFASKGQKASLRKFDDVLDSYSSFSVQKVAGLDESMAKEVAPAEIIAVGPVREMMEKRSEIYWTTLAPNVDDYSGMVAKTIAKGSGQLIKGILWCGDVTVERLKWGEEMMKRRSNPCSQPTEVSKEALKNMKRVKRVTKMSEKVVSGVLDGVIKVSGFVTGSLVNSKAGKKFFGLLPGEIALATLDGFGKVSDAVEVVGRNVLQTSSVVTTGVVSHRYGEQAGEITHEGFGAAGHALGTALAVFKIRKALNPKSAIKPSTLAKTAIKSAAAEKKADTNKQAKK